MKIFSLLKKQSRYITYFVILLIMIIGSILILSSEQTLQQRIAAAKEYERPANLALIHITTPDCSDCFDSSLAVKAIESENVHITESKEVTFDSEEGQALIAQHNVSKIPTVILTGEITKETVSAFIDKNTTLSDDGAVWTNILPVYLDASTGQAIGRVTATYLTDQSCKDCYSPTVHKAILEQQFGVSFIAENTVDVSSPEGSKLVSDYQIDVAPTIILSAEANAYPNLAAAWKSVGSIEKNGSFIFRKLSALQNIVYKNIESGEIIDLNPPQK